MMLSDCTYIENFEAPKSLNNGIKFFNVHYGDIISLDFKLYVYSIDNYSIDISSIAARFQTKDFGNFKNKKQIRKSLFEAIDSSEDLQNERRKKVWKKEVENVINELQTSMNVLFPKIFLKVCGL